MNIKTLKHIKSPLRAMINKNLKKYLKKQKEMNRIKVERKHLIPYDREVKNLMRGKVGRIKILGKEDNK